MVADRFALLIGTDAGGDLAARLWQVMTTPDAAFEDVLSVIAAIGIGHLPDFALVELVDAATSSVSVAVRGEAAIDLHGPQRSSYAGGGVNTWVEGSAQHVGGIELRLPGAPSEETLPLGRGVARATGLQWGAPTSGSTPLRAAEAQALDAELFGDPRIHSDVDADAAADAEIHTEFLSEPDDARNDGARTGSATDDGGRGGIDAIDPLETVSVDREQLTRAIASRRSAEAPSPPADVRMRTGRRSPDAAPPEVDDETILGARRPSAMADAAPAAHRLVLRLEPGGELSLDHPVVLGRAPKASEHPGARIAAVPSRRKEISGSHLEVRLDGSQLVLRDLASTNGTVVRSAEGTVDLLRGSAIMRVELGAVLDLGDGVIAVFDSAR